MDYEMNQTELLNHNVDVFVILQQINKNPDMLQYYLSVYGAKLEAMGFPLNSIILK